MMLERTISQLDVGHVSARKALEMGQLGYLQWLGSLKGDVGYQPQAMQAYALALPSIRTSPAIAVFCQLLAETCASPCHPIEYKLRISKRRGGAKARRDMT